MTVCEECGELLGDSAKACPWSGLFLCGECGHDESIAAEDRHYEQLEHQRDGSNGG